MFDFDARSVCMFMTCMGFRDDYVKLALADLISVSYKGNLATFHWLVFLSVFKNVFSARHIILLFGNELFILMATAAVF